LTSDQKLIAVLYRTVGPLLEVSFWEHFKVGAPLTVVTIAVGILCL
jgi:hypothetical protein